MNTRPQYLEQTTISVPSFASLAIDTRQFGISQFSTLLEMCSAIDVILNGIASNKNCKVEGTCLYNDAGAFIDNVVDCFFETKLKLVDALKSYIPKTQKEAEQRAYMLLHYNADMKILTVTEIASLALSLAAPKH